METDQNKDSVISGSNNEIKKTSKEVNLALDKLFRIKIPYFQKPIDRILIASRSASKQNLLNTVLSSFNIELITPGDSEVIPEEKYQRVLQEIVTPSTKYSPRLSAYKLTQFIETLQGGTGAIAFDTTVIADNGEVLEKPRNITEARTMITKITTAPNNVVTVIDGVTFIVVQENENPIIWRGAAEIAIMIKQSTVEDVEDYLNQQEYKVLNVAGGIDYASEEGKRFINSALQAPMIVGLGKVGPIQTLNDTIKSGLNQCTKRVLIANSASSVLIPYFKGIPTHLVQGIIRNFSH